MKQIGRVGALFRYPVKSMAGEQVERATLGFHGLEGDRRFALLRETSTSGFPWLTAGKLPALIRYRPTREPGADSTSPPTYVVTPSGDDLALCGDALREEISRACGEPVRIVQINHGVFDEASISVIAASTVDEIARLSGVAADVRRFRPNLFVEVDEGMPFDEDAWVGTQLAFGSPTVGPAVATVLRDLRCAMVNLDPDTGEASPEVLKAVVRANQNFAGVYATVLRPGEIAVGDPVFLSKADTD